MKKYLISCGFIMILVLLCKPLLYAGVTGNGAFRSNSTNALASILITWDSVLQSFQNEVERNINSAVKTQFIFVQNPSGVNQWILFTSEGNGSLGGFTVAMVPLSNLGPLSFEAPTTWIILTPFQADGSRITASGSIFLATPDPGQVVDHWECVVLNSIEMSPYGSSNLNSRRAVFLKAGGFYSECIPVASLP